MLPIDLDTKNIERLFIAQLKALPLDRVFIGGAHRENK